MGNFLSFLSNMQMSAMAVELSGSPIGDFNSTGSPIQTHLSIGRRPETHRKQWTKQEAQWMMGFHAGDAIPLVDKAVNYPREADIFMIAPCWSDCYSEFSSPGMDHFISFFPTSVRAFDLISWASEFYTHICSISLPFINPMNPRSWCRIELCTKCASRQ